jgi:hypothetical protein
MISPELAHDLRNAGLRWHPQSGDQFQINVPDLDVDVFTVSDMTIEAHHYPTGSILGFNGTTEWALDSVALEDALWLPREDQLREMLRTTFRSLTRLPDAYRVDVELHGEIRSFEHPEPSDAYGMALLALIQLSTV